MANTPKLFTPDELGGDRFLAAVINTRFVAFLARFKEENGLKWADVCETSCRILEAAEIPQDTTINTARI